LERLKSHKEYLKSFEKQQSALDKKIIEMKRIEKLNEEKL